MNSSNGDADSRSSWWNQWTEQEWRQWRLEQRSAAEASLTSPPSLACAPAVLSAATSAPMAHRTHQWHLDQSFALRLSSTSPPPLPQTPEIDDGIRTPPTPPLSAFRDTHSDEEIFAFHGILRFVINGTQSDDIAFDHVSSYGWLVHQARSWCQREFFALTFPLQDPTYNVFVSSRQIRPRQSTACVCYRRFVDKIFQDCFHVMMPGKYLEVTVVVESLTVT